MATSKPTKLKLASIPFSKGRAAKSDPTLAGIPSPPDWLSDAARPIWDKFSPICFQNGSLTEADVSALARYAEMTVQWLECQRIISACGLTFEITTKKGESTYLAPRPEVAISNRLAIQLRALEKDLGLNQPARKKLGISQANQSTPKVATRKRS